MTMKDAKKALKRLRENMDALGGKVVLVGLPKDIVHNPSGLPMSELGAVHEFGDPDQKIPERSFLRSTLITKKDETQSNLNKIIKNVAKDGADPETQLEKLALWFQGEVQETITELDAPPNAPSTIAAKGSDNPLIDTGEMRQAVIGIVVDGD